MLELDAAPAAAEGWDPVRHHHPAPAPAAGRRVDAADVGRRERAGAVARRLAGVGLRREERPGPLRHLHGPARRRGRVGGREGQPERAAAGSEVERGGQVEEGGLIQPSFRALLVGAPARPEPGRRRPDPAAGPTRNLWAAAITIVTPVIAEGAPQGRALSAGRLEDPPRSAHSPRPAESHEPGGRRPGERRRGRAPSHLERRLQKGRAGRGDVAGAGPLLARELPGAPGAG